MAIQRYCWVILTKELYYIEVECIYINYIIQLDNYIII